MKKVDFEAHYYPPEFLDRLAARNEYPYFRPEKFEIAFCDDFSLTSEFKVRHLTEPIEERLAIMDRYGIDMQVLSVSAGVELLSKTDSIKAARRINDYVYSIINQYPGRFSAFASLPVNVVDEAAKELERCINELGFFGWNTFSNFGSKAPDDDCYLPLFEKAAELNVPVYIHPAQPYDGNRLKGLGAQLSAASFGFGIDTSITIMRMILKGVLDRYPNLKLMTGHLGEIFPFILKRMDERGKNYKREPAVNKEAPGYYFRNNIWVTTSGQYSQEAFQCAKDVLGTNHILFGSDYPYEQPQDVEDFFYELNLSESEREKLFFRNAEENFGLIVPPSNIH